MENLELGERVLAHVTEYPGEFDMRRWGYIGVCGTSACLAGHTMLQAGYTIRVEQNGTDTHFIRPNGSMVELEDYEARDLLGLTDEEYWRDGLGDAIFYLGDDDALEEFRRVIEDERDRRAAAPRETDLPAEG